MTVALYWFRQDLRLADNPALWSAVQENTAFIPIYIFDEDIAWSLGRAQHWWLHHSLKSLQNELLRQKIVLVLRKGQALPIITEIVQSHAISSVYWNRCYEPARRKLDDKIHALLIGKGIAVHRFNGSLLHEPSDIFNQKKNYFKVFSPYWRNCITRDNIRALFPVPTFKKTVVIASDSLKKWNLLPKSPDWTQGFAKKWRPGEANAHRLLKDFLANDLQGYEHNRDCPYLRGASHLSPYLHFGEISPVQIWYAVQDIMCHGQSKFRSAERYLMELGWREFAYYWLFHFPDFPKDNFRPEFNNFSWQTNAKFLKAWQRGQTGYPIVDAGMSELWSTGYMHNRVRMIVASFLTKDLLIDWREGQNWFWHTLLDADLANNSFNWQWVAGCGADAAPYFRIFNPVLQGEKFDPQGTYVKNWLPKLKLLPSTYVHKPWLASVKILSQANLELGIDYPLPIVDHAQARQRALYYFQQLKNSHE